MKINFNGFTDMKKKCVYGYLDTTGMDVYQSLWHNVLSNNSYSFTRPNTAPGNKGKELMKVFGIKDKVAFNAKFAQATNGDGNEISRITVLTSSAMAALLFFYNVSDKNPITIELNGKAYRFTKSYFEVKTRVLRGNSSNMDVVLVDWQDNTILFLECKFSEYLSTGKSNNISLGYINEYEKFGLIDDKGNNVIQDKGCLGKMEIKNDMNNGNACLSISPKNANYQYCAGIKQMLSHYIGVSNAMKNGCTVDGIQLPQNAKVFLAEMVFDFENSFIGYLANYKTAYGTLAGYMNGTNCGGPEMNNELLTYQEVFNDKKNECFLNNMEMDIKKFYRL